MRTECFVLECLIKKWLNNNEFIKENKTTVLLESLNKLDKSISLNFRHLDEALKYIEVHTEPIDFGNGINIVFDKSIIKGIDRGTVIGRFKTKRYER